LPEWTDTLSAQTSSWIVLPRPQSSKSAARPLRMDHSTIAAWNGNRYSGSQSGANPWSPSSWALRSRNAAYSVAVLTYRLQLLYGRALTGTRRGDGGAAANRSTSTQPSPSRRSRTAGIPDSAVCSQARRASASPIR
jgi:hypothetical protein